MYRRLSVTLFPILIIALIGAGIWGYREHQEKNAVLIKAENQYQRAFNDLTYHMDQLHQQLGNALAVGSDSTQFHRKSLVNVWRITSQAQSEINQLPLTLMPFNKTEEFLSNISKFSYTTAVRDLTKAPLSDNEVKTLHTLYDRAKDLSSELRKVQATVLDKRLRWMDVEMAMATQNIQQDNTIIDGFKTVDKKVSEYSEVDWGPSGVDLFKTRTYSTLSGQDITKDEARKIAFEFLNLPLETGVRVVENGAGSEYSSYSITVMDGPDAEGRLNVDVSKKGGKVIYFLNHRVVEQSDLTVDQASEAALQFLQEHDYSDMRAISYDTYQNIAAITFAAVQNDVIIYPEKLVVKVALDNGEITGLQASNYLFEHHSRQIAKPQLSTEEARKMLNKNFDVQASHLAIINSDLDEEVLCHEFTGRINDQIYRIYLNADTGLEEKIEQIREAEANMERH